MESVEHKHLSLGPIVATIGAILIGLGVAWLIALNWSDIPSAFKILILIIATGTAYSTGIFLRIKNYHKIGGSLIFLGAILYTLSIFLIAQIFNLPETTQFNAHLLLLAWIGILVVSYIFDSTSSLILALTQFLIWISLQFFSFTENFRGDFAIGILAIIYLAVGVLLYGLTQFHKSNNHEFSGIYRYWTAFYILLITYILSFQSLLPILWPTDFQINSGMLIFLLTISFISLIVAAIGIITSLNKKKLSGKEVISFVLITVLYIILISSASLVSGAKTGFRGGMDTGLFLMWIFDNILFIIVILAVIGYGVRYKSSNIVNLGIIFFALDILTRYIGFWLDLGGQIGFAVMAIIGGIILLIGGWLIEKWRKDLVTKTKSNKNIGYSIT
jgi:uncharacterized membrane protein